MGMIVEFPADAAARRLAHVLSDSPREGMGTVVILPVVRIERHSDDSTGGNGPKEGTAPGRPRKRRARS